MVLSTTVAIRTTEDVFSLPPLSLSGNGRVLAVGGSVGIPVAYIYTRSSDASDDWYIKDKLSPSDGAPPQFGHSIGVSSNGLHIYHGGVTQR